MRATFLGEKTTNGEIRLPSSNATHRKNATLSFAFCPTGKQCFLGFAQTSVCVLTATHQLQIILLCLDGAIPQPVPPQHLIFCLCVYTGTHPLQIIFSNRHEIRRLNVSQKSYVSMVSGLRNTIALDFYYNKSSPTGDGSQIFWTDVVDDKIYAGTMISNCKSTPAIITHV